MDWSSLLLGYYIHSNSKLGESFDLEKRQALTDVALSNDRFPTRSKGVGELVHLTVEIVVELQRGHAPFNLYGAPRSTLLHGGQAAGYKHTS